MDKIPYQEISRRIEKLQNHLREQEIEAAVIAQNVDILYFTGSCQSGHLIIPAEGEPCYLVNKSFPRAQQESPLQNIQLQKKLRELPAVLNEISPGAKKIGMELDVLPASLYFRYQNLFPEADISDISPAVKEIRSVKSTYEIEIFKKGAELSTKMFEEAPRFLSEGKKEVEFAAEVECFLRSNGHQGAVRMRQFNQEVFFGHIMAGGDNVTYSSFFNGPTGGPGLSPAYPQGAGWKEISKNEQVLLDYVTAYNGYNVDCTRSFCIGDLPQELKDAHQAALEIQNEIVETVKPGNSCSKVFMAALKKAQDLGYEDTFMGYGSDKAAFIAHGVGLELDELPVLTDKHTYPLQEGMVFALEPKIVLPGVGVAGVENTILVTSHGLEKLTQAPEEITYL